MRSKGIGIRMRAAALLALGQMPAGEMVWPGKSVSVAPIFALDGENFRRYFRNCLKIFLMLRMRAGGPRTEDDDVIEVGGHVGETFDELR